MVETGHEEAYEEWLGRLDIPVEQLEDIEELRTMLRQILGFDPNELQLEALWGARTTQWDLGEAGIRGVTVEYPWGKERRYGIQGLPGLWGWDRVREIMTAEGWW